MIRKVCLGLLVLLPSAVLSAYGLRGNQRVRGLSNVRSLSLNEASGRKLQMNNEKGNGKQKGDVEDEDEDEDGRSEDETMGEVEKGDEDNKDERDQKDEKNNEDPENLSEWADDKKQDDPTSSPTEEALFLPITFPTAMPLVPTAVPTYVPTAAPTFSPTVPPTFSPTADEIGNDEKKENKEDEEEVVDDKEEDADIVEEVVDEDAVDEAADGTADNEHTVVKGEETEAPTASTGEEVTVTFTPAPTSDSTDTQSINNDTALTSVTLAPFSIPVDYPVLLEEDPGIEDYLEAEMKKRYGALVAIELQFSSASVDSIGGKRQRMLLQQVISYSGVALFESMEGITNEEVILAQTELIQDETSMSAAMQASLGDTEDTLTVYSIDVETSSFTEDSNKISNGGIILLMVVAILVAIVLSVICSTSLTAKRSAINKKDKKVSTKERSKISTNGNATLPEKEDQKLSLAPELQKGAVDCNNMAHNTTMETEALSLDTRDQIREDFAQNMEKHSFAGSWKKTGGEPVQLHASVMRGTLVEKASASASQSCIEGVPSDEESVQVGAGPNELNRELENLAAEVQTARDKAQNLELNLELNELASSVKAAKLKTADLLKELNAETDNRALK